MERKFARNPELHQQHQAFIQSLRHMSPINDDVKDDEYYLSHHAVLQYASSTTKLRVIIDASSKIPNRFSLNNFQYVGSTTTYSVLQFIFEIINLLSQQIFRCCIGKFSSHWKKQNFKILWRHTPEKEIKSYRVNTITYGIKCSASLAISCLQQLVKEHSTQFPLAAAASQSDYYVDDFITRTDTIEDLNTLKSNVESILSQGGFELHKLHLSTPSRSSAQNTQDNLGSIYGYIQMQHTR